MDVSGSEWIWALWTPPSRICYGNSSRFCECAFWSSVSRQSRLLSNEHDAVTAHAGTTGATTWGHDIAPCHRLAMVTAAVSAATSRGPATAPRPTETADVVVMRLTGGASIPRQVRTGSEAATSILCEFEMANCQSYESCHNGIQFVSPAKEPPAVRPLYPDKAARWRGQVGRTEWQQRPQRRQGRQRCAARGGLRGQGAGRTAGVQASTDLTDAERVLFVFALPFTRAGRALERCAPQSCTLRICSWHCGLQPGAAQRAS